MGFNKAQTGRLRTAMRITDSRVTQELSAGMSDDVELSIVAAKITVQNSDGLTGTIEVSCDGVNFISMGVIPAPGTMLSYSTHLVAVVRVNCTGGSGLVTILASS